MILTYFYCVIVALIVESLIALTHDIPYKGVKDLLKTTNKSVYIPLINIIFIFVGVVVLIQPMCSTIISKFRKK